MREYTVAILGATGAVGSRLIEQLEQSTIPVKKVKLLASKRSAGKQLNFKGRSRSKRQHQRYLKALI